MNNDNSVFDQLSNNRDCARNIPEYLGSGIYAVFTKDVNHLPGITLPLNGVIYIGKSKTLELRNHFVTKHSGFSTLRRSIGAILKVKLNLSAEPRSKGCSKTNYRNFRFSGEGEKHLTEWMQSNLEYSIFAIDGDLASLESNLIVENEPTLNLTEYENSQKHYVQHLRKLCREEARLIWEKNCLAEP